MSILIEKLDEYLEIKITHNIFIGHFDEYCFHNAIYMIGLRSGSNADYTYVSLDRFCADWQFARIKEIFLRYCIDESIFLEVRRIIKEID